jgi:hypothetical protein
MILFLAAYVLIYGSMQVVFFLRVQPLLPQLAWVRLLLGAFLLLMVAAPILTRVLEGAGQSALATGLAWIGYSWMGFVFLAFCLGVILFAAEAALALIPKAFGAAAWRLHPQWSAAILLLVCLGLSLYGLYESKQLRLETLRLTTEKLPADRRLRVVQISDLHLGLLVNEGAVRRIVRRIEAVDPDLLLCTGDLVDGNLESLRRLAPSLASLSPPLGAYAVSGNHETYAGLEASFRFFREAGFRPLQDQGIQVGDRVALVGMSYSREKRCSSEETLLQRMDAKDYTILLKHSPLVCPKSPGRIDLQLSGHTHKGQIFPFSLVVQAVYPYFAGLHDLGSGSKIYVSRGTGTWGPQMRILAPPELTVIDIVGRPGKAEARSDAGELAQGAR